MHMKSRKNLQRIGKKYNDLNKMQKKNINFSKKSNKYHTNHQEISYKYLKNISIQSQII